MRVYNIQLIKVGPLLGMFACLDVDSECNGEVSILYGEFNDFVQGLVSVSE